MESPFLGSEQVGVWAAPRVPRGPKLKAARLGDLRGEIRLAFCPFETTSVYQNVTGCINLVPGDAVGGDTVGEGDERPI